MELVVAMPVLRNDENSKLSPHFGRAPFFSIAKIKDGQVVELKFIRNIYSQAHGHHIHGQGSHYLLFQSLLENKVNTVIALHIGHGAFQNLVNRGIKVYLGVSGTIKENLDKLIKGELKEITVENADLLVSHEHHHH